MCRMVKQRDFRRLLLPGAFLLIALVIWLGLMSQFHLDDSFITYRYARNFARGWGLVYNQGDAVLSTTAPLYAMLLAAGSFILPDFQVLGGLIGALSIAAGGLLIVGLLPRRMPAGIRVWAGLVYLLSSPLWLALGMETPLWIMLVLAAVWSAMRDRWPWAGLLIGLAVLTRPDAALPGVLLAVTALGVTLDRLNTRRRPWLPILGYIGMAAVPVILFGLWAWSLYGSPLPATLGAKGAQAVLGITGMGAYVTPWDGLRLILRSLMVQSPLYIALGLLVIFGLAGRTNGPVFIIVAWGALHLLAYMVMKVAPYRWYYAPLVPGMALLAAAGLDYLMRRLALRKVRFAPYIVGAIAVFPLLAQAQTFTRIEDQIEHGGPADVMLPIVDWKAYQEVGEWLHDQTPTNARIGVAEVGQVGFYADRWMTDYLGLLQPDVANMIRRGDLYSWLAGYAPDYLVFQRFRGAPLVLYNYMIGDDAWFRANYQQEAEFDDPRYSSGPVTIFQRVTPDKVLREQPVQLEYGGLRLVGLATDGYDLSPEGGPVRVRLDWEVAGALPTDLHIAAKGLNMPGNPSFDGDYQTMLWKGRFSTWHGFVVPKDVQPGGYPLLVAVGPKGGPYQEQVAGRLDVSFPKTDAKAETVFASAGAPQVGLVEQKAGIADGKLRLEWAWRAETDIAADYAYFVHVLPASGGAPAAQADGQPRDGSYPTSLWQHGEVVPFSVDVDISKLDAGNYNVEAGWYSPSDQTRLKADNADAIPVTRIVVTGTGGAIITPASGSLGS
jgi:hypothetical protein